MRYAKIVVLALSLASCGEITARKETQVATLPPNMFQDCVQLTTLDDACTRTWYQCRLGGTGDNASCVSAWEQCCTLRGQGARSRTVTAGPVDR